MPENINNTVTNPSEFEEVSDLIEHPPSWLLRSGASMVAMVVFSVLMISSFIKYPDKIVATGILTSETPPIELISKSDGYIQQVLTKDLDKIKAGKGLLIIKNTAIPGDIDSLKKWIKQYQQIQKPEQYPELEIFNDLQVGIIQNNYASLVLKFNEFKQILDDNIVFQQIRTISAEINKIKHLNKSLGREKKLFKEELNLAEKDYQRQESLFKSQIISQVEFEKAKAQLLQRQRQFEGMENSIIQNEIRIDQLVLNQLKLESERSKKINEIQFQIDEIIAKLNTNILNWSDSYIIKAPIAGEISFLNRIKENKFINRGEILGHILPLENNHKFISIKAPTYNGGKIELEQRVILKFDAFPYKEFGIVETKISEIASLPQISENGESFYEIRAILPEKIISDFEFEIPYKPNMMVSAEIITEDKSILERIFNQLLSLIKHN